MKMTGSIQEKKGKLYIVLNTRKEGVRKQKWVNTGLTAKGNKKKARELLNEILANEDSANYFTKKDKILFSDFLAKWLEERLTSKKSPLQRTTYDGYNHIIQHHIKPYFDDKSWYLHELESENLEQYYEDKEEEGLSSNSVIKHHQVISSALAWAKKKKLVKINVASLADKPQKKGYKANYYTLDELNRLLDASKETPLETVILLAARYGLRKSEILGLRWGNIDFENRTISIAHKVVRIVDDNGKSTYLCSDNLKTEESRRAFPLSDDFTEHLLQLKERQQVNRRRHGYNRDYVEYVCVDATGGLIKPDYVTHKFAKILDYNGLRKIRFHDLRHPYVKPTTKNLS
ncbi:tyrosine-type recombinase/integrase, partial [Christensenellaceae bacterium OttesenSCG-928-K19]|nr:tyrosine-type recombinase/integrase [Christensenellaceae bacterium OttesenSCG-928-K19]